jgi:hypothetical protein
VGLHVRCEDAVRQIFDRFNESEDRYAVHAELRPVIGKLCTDREFIHDAIRRSIIKADFLEGVRVLSLPIAESGDVSLAINLFAPIRDRAPEIAADYIHHHGWRLLTTGVITGGYDTIVFERGSHQDRTNGAANLRIQSMCRHAADNVMFIDSHTPHLVFHPPNLSATLALWSADKRLVNQNIKRLLGNFPVLRRTAAQAVRRLGLADMLGLNDTKGVFYRPSRGQIIEALHDGELDVERDETIECVLKFMQQVQFDDVGFLDLLKEKIPTHSSLIAQVASADPLADTGIRGNPKRRFTKGQVLQAIERTAE